MVDEAPEAPATPEKQARVVLYVTDAQVKAEGFKSAFTSELSTRIALSPSEAFSEDGVQPLAVVVDLATQRLDGLPLMREARRRYPKAMRVAVVSASESELVDGAKAAGVIHEYVVEPGAPGDIVDGINRALKAQQPQSTFVLDLRAFTKQHSGEFKMPRELAASWPLRHTLAPFAWTRPQKPRPARTQSLGQLIAALELEASGVGVAIVAPHQELEVAAAITQTTTGFESARAFGSLDELRGKAGPRGLVISGPFPADLLRQLNDRRNSLSASGRQWVLVIARPHLVELRRYASDLSSALAFQIEVPFAPNPEVEEDEAREELRDWHRKVFGRLDLRGLVRAESEDVSWQVEDIYEELEVQRTFFARGSRFVGSRQTVMRALNPIRAWSSATEQRGSIQAILGHPGSGKTFFLRWLALEALRSSVIFERSGAFPVLASLAGFRPAPDRDLFDHLLELWLEAKLSAAHLLGELAAAGRALFLLDGLDESGDAATRAQVRDAVQALAERFPHCQIIVTSRIAGYSEATLQRGGQFVLAPLSDEAIERFSRRWCLMYSVALHGDHPHVRSEAEKDAAQLFADVISNPQVRELARSPLLLTVLAVVHRAGVRLPDHRIELYSQAAHVLIERWNRVRSLSRIESAPTPIRVSDGVRVLGPIAISMIRGRRTTISQAGLERSIADSLGAGQIRSLASSREALDLFRSSIGLLVEQAPRSYSFLHLSLAEFFAALELVRTGELEELIEDSSKAFWPEYREVLLLALAELGVHRADDERLSAMVAAILRSADRRPGQPSPSVPSLLSGILADDPGLSADSSRSLVDALVGKWWLGRRYRRRGLVFFEAASLAPRLRSGRFFAQIRARLLEGLDPSPRGLDEPNASSIQAFVELLMAFDIDWWRAFGHKRTLALHVPTDVDSGRVLVVLPASLLLDDPPFVSIEARLAPPGELQGVPIENVDGPKFSAKLRDLVPLRVDGEWTIAELPTSRPANPRTVRVMLFARP
ncbi:MAG: NACHT domain-containing protein [Deltaproteobacteria bacterium]|nr:NACHT domain-containing protein [Deltaproteobacteria bacterium]